VQAERGTPVTRLAQAPVQFGRRKRQRQTPWGIGLGGCPGKASTCRRISLIMGSLSSPVAMSRHDRA